jgi:glutathione S-transferase
MVRDKLQALGLKYETIEVPGRHSDRTAVFEVSGQYLVPVLVDGEVMLDDEEKILPYLDKRYGSG